MTRARGGHRRWARLEPQARNANGFGPPEREPLAVYVSPFPPEAAPPPWLTDPRNLGAVR